MTRRNGAPAGHRARLALSCAALLGLVPASPGMALGFKTADHALRRLPVSKSSFSLHPFFATEADKPQGFNLFENGSLSFNDTIVRMLRDHMSNPLVEIRSSASQTGLGLSTGSQSHDFRFYVGGVPLCGFHLRAHELADRSTLVLGDLPAVDLNEPLPARDWPDLELARDKVAELLAEQGARGTARVTGTSRCLYNTGGSLLPVWSMTATVEGLPYKALADAYEVVSMQAGFFDVDGTGNAFEFNKLTGEAKDFPLTDLVGDGTLASTFLRTFVPTTVTPAKEPTNVFKYPATDPRFDEVQAYVHAQLHFDFFKSLGFEWYGPTPLEVRIHVKPAGRSNNALFIPGSTVDNTLPSISIDDGDGIDLQFLVTDGDVVSHEFGHHVIYKTLHSTDGESLVLHEGLADSFVFARTGDGCLGESICPKGSGACVLEGQCLRTAVNDLKYDDQMWNQWAGPKYRLGHLHGQLVSGFVWDLRKDGKMSPADVNALVFKAISYFRDDSGLRDFVLAMFTADKELFAGKNFDLIHQTAEARNMNEFMTDVQPGSIPALAGGGSGVLPPGSTEQSTSSKKKDKGDENPLKCGTISFGSAGASPLLVLLLISLPLLLAATPVPVRTLHRSLTRNRRRPK